MKRSFLTGLCLIILPFLTKAQTKKGIPDVRAHHALVYHPGEKLTYLIGGSTRVEGGYHYYNDVWIWDGSNWNRDSGAELPFPRSSQRVVYHSNRNSLIMFGGGFQVATKAEGVFWEYNPSIKGNKWEAIGGDFRAGKDEPGVCYDKSRDKVVIFGGWDQSVNYTEDTWEWDGVSFAQVDTAGPAPRAGHMFVYDSVRESCLLFGGRGPDGFWDDTWEWDGEQWNELNVKGPSARWFFGSAADLSTGQIIIFGGRGTEGDLNDTWVWDGEKWSQPNMKGGSPIARSMGKLAYSRNGILLFGGRHSTENGFIDLNDTWLFKNNTWTQKTEAH